MAKSELEARFEFEVLRFVDAQPEQQYRFHTTRRWLFDYAWPAQMLAVEIDGGQWKAGGGRHNTDKDREKLNAAAVLGWRVLRYSGSMLNNPHCVAAEITEALEQSSMLARACRALICAVDFTAEPGNYDVRPRDPVNAAKALAEIAGALG